MGSVWLTLRADLRLRWRVVIAAGPGWAAARIRPALVLRSE